jgi:hypothetical protein
MLIVFFSTYSARLLSEAAARMMVDIDPERKSISEPPSEPPGRASAMKRRYDAEEIIPQGGSGSELDLVVR